MPLVGVLIVVALSQSIQDSPPPAGCGEWHECRQLAQDAAERKDFERFHDLAWRAVQMGPRNDPALMYLLARAQSLSGRPGDALVMLGRLADAAIAVDAITSADFERVRGLPAWPALRARIEGHDGVPSPPSAVPSTPAAVPAGLSTSSEPSREPSRTSDVNGTPNPETVRTIVEGAIDASDAAKFLTPGASPIAIAYDVVSRRFVVADRATRKLTVVDEFTQHVATLAGAQAAFADISAVEIDPREGNLWVVSSESGGASQLTTLHKLQLVSGRVLSALVLPAPLAPGHFVDVAVTSQGSVLALDDRQPRVVRLRGTTFEIAATLDVVAPASLAPADNGILYVAHRDGLVRLDLGSGASTVLKPPQGQSLSGLGHMRWHRGSLVGIQRHDDGLKAVRVLLDRSGRMVQAIELIDPSASAAEASAAAIAGNTVYYLAESAAGEAIVRRVRLK